jgi:hypothetical protein
VAWVIVFLFHLLGNNMSTAIEKINFRQKYVTLKEFTDLNKLSETETV